MPARKKKNKIDAGDAIGNPQAVTAYKGFDKDFKCREFQFAVGQTYTHDGTVKMCEGGFHACERPMDVLRYYSPRNGCRYALVTLRGVSDERSYDAKRVAAEITIDRELTLRDLIAAELNYCARVAEKAASSGHSSVVFFPGHNSTASSSGDYETAASSGDYSTAASVGRSSAAVSEGDNSSASSCGYFSIASSLGFFAKASSSGEYSTAASAGENSTAASVGKDSTAVSVGSHSKAASAGCSSEAASSGEYSTAASSGEYSRASCDANGFACVAGINGAVKGGPGSALALGYCDAGGRRRIKVLYVGEDGIEPDTWYHCNADGVPFKVQ